MGRVLCFPGGRGWLAALLVVMLAGCATPRSADHATEAVRADGPELSGGQGRVREAFSPGGSPDGFGVAWCTNLYEALEGQVRNRQVVDAGEQRLPGYPFLRSNRFLASFAPDFSAQLEAGKPADDAERATRAAALLQTPAFRDWIGRLQQLDTHVRRLEVNRLPDESVPLYHLPNRMQLEDSLSRCAPLMAAHLTPADVPRVLQQAAVPDEYRRSLRALGLYPLTGIGVASSIRNWEADQRRVFRSERRPSLSGRASFQRYRPAQQISGADAWRTAAQIMRDVPRDALGIPQFSAAQRELLFVAFAPTWEVATTTDSDRIGRLQWIDLAGLVRDPDERFWLDVDTNVPVVYQRLSFTRFGDAVLPQLEYLVWFSDRPMQGSGDLQGGRLDGLIWRVTLDTDGAPLIYDTIQPSGRYAMFFPTRRLQVNRAGQAAVESLAEWVYSPIDTAIEDWVGETWPGPLTLWVSSGTHQLVGVSRPGRNWGSPVFDNPPYRLESSDMLRALPVPGGVARSIYNQDGVVSGTERLGRLLFWAMGVSNVGAMRQSGHQPTALVGRRHFDDAWLFDKRYVRVPVKR